MARKLSQVGGQAGRWREGGEAARTTTTASTTTTATTMEGGRGARMDDGEIEAGGGCEGGGYEGGEFVWVGSL